MVQFDIKILLELLKPAIFPFFLSLLLIVQIYQNFQIWKIQSAITQMNQEKQELERENEYIKTGILTQTSQEKIDSILSGKPDIKKVIPRSKIIYLKLPNSIE